MERLNPLNDYLFLKLMGEEGNEIQCLSFLNAVLGSKGKMPVKLVKILENKTFTPEVLGNKTCILDVRAVLQYKTKVNIEVQLLSKILDNNCYPSKYIILFIFYKAI